MEIIEQDYKWAKPLYKRQNTNYCVIHHEAGSGMTAMQIHNMHINQNGWAGIGYHFYIRKDGKIYRGRPLDMMGTHTMNYNGATIGVCFEGNFENEQLTNRQYASGVELLDYILEKYPNIEFKRHKDLNATACPGKNFPFEKMIGDVCMTGEQIEAKAKEYRCSKEESDWSAKEGSWQKATDKKIVNGKNPQDYITRQELIAVLGRMGLIK